MFQELLKEISNNPQSARMLQEALANQQQHLSTLGPVSSASSTISTAMPSTSTTRGVAVATNPKPIASAGKPSQRSDSSSVVQQLQQDVAWWKQRALESHRRLLILQEQSFISATRAHHDAPFLDWPDGDELSMVEDLEEDDQGAAAEHAPSEAVDRFRSGSAVEIPDSRRGRRLEVGGNPPSSVRSASQLIRGGGGMPAMVVVPSPGPLVYHGIPPRSGAPSNQLKSRRTPRTPSLTAADRVDRGGYPVASHSRSIAIGSSPVVAPPLPVPLQRADVIAHTGYPAANPYGSNAAYHSASAVIAARQAAAAARPPVHHFSARSPAPNPPQAHHSTFAQGNRSGAPMRSGLGGVEAESRGASSAASSVAGALRAVRAGGTRSPSPQNPKRGSNSFRNLILSGVSAEEREAVTQAIGHLTNARLVGSDTSDTLPSLVTHVVTPGGGLRSFKALCAYVSAKYVITPQYVIDSAKAGYWLEELDFPTSHFIPTKPLEHQQFLVTMDDASLCDLVKRVIVYGGGSILHTARKALADDVVVIRGAQELLDFIATKSQT